MSQIPSGSGAVATESISLSLADFTNSLKAQLQLAYGQEAGLVAADSAAYTAFIAKIAPLSAGVIQDQINGVGNYLVALAEIRDLTYGYGQSLASGALAAQHIAFSQAVAGFINGLVTLATKVAVINPYASLAVTAVSLAVDALESKGS